MENGIIFNLKTFREDMLAGMSQEEFAKQVGISQDRVSRMEADPSKVSLDVLIAISTHFGISLDSLVKIQPPVLESLNPDYTWSKLEFIRRSLIEYIKSYKGSDTYKEDVETLSELIEKGIRKPKVAFVGRSDVGKSTMINTLLGSSKMPAHWTPATAIAVYVKHINDRPAYMDEDVWIFKSDEESRVWDDTRLSDEKYCRSLRLTSGNFDLLNTYGTRKGEHFAKSQATSAVVFIDSNMLLNCDVVDLPGYGTGDREADDSLSLQEKDKADVIVYLSIANGFMRSEDISYVQNAIYSLPNLSEYEDCGVKYLDNLYFVASQAHVVDNGNRKSLEYILSSGCERFENSCSPGFWNGNKDYFSKRFYTYTSNDNLLCERFRKDLSALLEKLPKIVEARGTKMIQEWIKDKDDLLADAIANFEKLLQDRAQCEELLKEYDNKEPDRKAEFLKNRQEISEKMKTYRKESISEMRQAYNAIINSDRLIELIKAKKVKKKKEDLQMFSNYISGLLQDEANHILKAKTNHVKKDIDEFLKGFEESTKVNVGSVSFKVPPFRKEQAFAAGLAGVATYGALAFWAATCGNLGGYILVAKGVSLLSALGISVGGTAAAISAVASIGGPVVLGIALAFIAAIAVFALTTGSWEKKVASQFIKTCEKNHVLDELFRSIEKYWDDTQKAFNAAADNLDKEWMEHLEKLRNHLANYDVESLKNAIEEAEEMRNFLSDVPLKKS